MKIKLQNIGIVKNSTIQLDGLTVVTGRNNSGKTTVGKVIYSLLDAVSNLQVKAQMDKTLYIEKKIVEVQGALEIFRFASKYESEKMTEIFGENSILGNLWNQDYRHAHDPMSAEIFAREVLNGLKSIDVNTIQDANFEKIVSRMMKNRSFSASQTNRFKEQLIKSVQILEELFFDLGKDEELIDYAREAVNQTLRVEFSNQIQPVSNPSKKSKIEFDEDGKLFFDIEINDNKIINTGKPIFYSSPFPKTYFIENPFIIDSQQTYYGMRRFYREQEIESNGTLLNYERIQTHENKLRVALKSRKKPTIFEETVLNESLSSIREQINQVIPGEFEFSSEGDYYVQDGNKLKISNLATGSKMFSIIKILLEKGEIDHNTMLILDEPETHLHPSWQNKFAEIIVLLVKELDVNILLTTHSSNFMLAIDAYMRKYNISSKTNFYQTNIIEKGFVEYQCVNDDMGKIYADFMQYLSEVKALRDSSINNQVNAND